MILFYLLACLFLISSFTGVSTGLKCYCEECIDRNQTCETTGVCLTIRSYKKDGTIKIRYRCTTELEESGLKIPHGEIFECLSGHPTASESSRLCCKDEDFCNKHLSPTFPPPTTRIPEIRDSVEQRLTFGTLELVGLIAGPVVLVSVFFVICFLSYRQCQQQGICMAPKSVSDGESQPFMQPGQTTDTLREMIMEYSGSGSGKGPGSSYPVRSIIDLSELR